MLALVALVGTLFQQTPTYPSRADFLSKLSHLVEGTPKAEVLRALGNPDRIEHPNDSEETWLYGTDGPEGAATLAQFEVYEGKLAYHPQSVPPPPTSVISERDLRKGLHIVLDHLPKDYGVPNEEYSVWIAKTVNLLLPFGEAKCKAIIGETGRLAEGWGFLNPVPYFLCYSLFDPPRPPGYFDVFGPVWNAPPPKDPHAYPRWPVDIVKNVPRIHGGPMGGFGGFAPSFISSYQSLRDRIHLRKSRLSIPKIRPVKQKSEARDFTNRTPSTEKGLPFMSPITDYDSPRVSTLHSRHSI